MAAKVKLENILFENLPQIIGYIKSLGKDCSGAIERSKLYIAGYKRNLQTASTEKTVNKYTGEVESSDADDYRFYISQEESKISRLQSGLKYFYVLQGLLNDILNVQLKLHEVQEVVAWQSSAAYAAITRYDRDEAPEINYDDKIKEYETELQALSEKCLQCPEIVTCINFIIAEKQKKKTVATQTRVHRR